MFIALSPLLYLGLGALVQELLPRGHDQEDPYRQLSLAYTTGLVANLALFFALPGFAPVLVALLALPGLWFFFRRLDGRAFFGRRAFLFFGLLFLALYKALIDPILDWDARSIWFFQAKMIFYQKGLNVAWDPARFLFANLDYPKLQPLLAGQTAALAGYWNEFLPKISLVHLFLPIAAFFTHLASKRPGFLVFAPMALLVTGSYLWNGYVDGFLALYLLMGATFLVQNLRDDLPPSHSIWPLAAATCLKNEGALAVAAFSLAYFLVQRGRVRGWRRSEWFSLIAFLPFVWWSVTKWQWQLPNQIFLVKPTWETVAPRLTLENLWPILRSMLTDGLGWRALSLLALAVLVWGWKPVVDSRRALAFLAVSTLVFLAGITAVLFASSMEIYQPQHLPFIMGRVMLTPLQLTFLAVYCLGESRRAD